MKVRQHIILRHLIPALGMAALVTLAAACSNEEAPQLYPQEESDLVLLGAGTGNNAFTRASSVPMPDGGRFACKMYYQTGVNGATYDAHTLAWLQVDGDAGNSLYRQASFVEPTEENKDLTYGFDKMASIFYWQNRQPHTFLALADYNRLNTIEGTAEGSILNDSRMNQEYANDAESGIETKPYIAFDLTRGEKTLYSEQPDPIRAVTTTTPAYYTPEANRVSLLFKHCFSQVEVNLAKSPDGSVNDLEAGNIVSVELMGVTAEGRVTPWIKPDGTYEAPSYKEVLAKDFTTEQWAASDRYGTVFNMFELTPTTTGYLKSYQAIAFGMLRAIRITWNEPVGEGAMIEHKVVRAVEAKYQTLKSGTRHIFNIQLRRGMLAVITADILPWEEDETNYKTDGSIDNN